MQFGRAMDTKLCTTNTSTADHSKLVKSSTTFITSKLSNIIRISKLRIFRGNRNEVRSIAHERNGNPTVSNIALYNGFISSQSTQEREEFDSVPPKPTLSYARPLLQSMLHYNP